MGKVDEVLVAMERGSDNVFGLETTHHLDGSRITTKKPFIDLIDTHFPLVGRNRRETENYSTRIGKIKDSISSSDRGKDVIVSTQEIDVLKQSGNGFVYGELKTAIKPTISSVEKRIKQLIRQAVCLEESGRPVNEAFWQTSNKITQRDANKLIEMYYYWTGKKLTVIGIKDEAATASSAESVATTASRAEGRVSGVSPPDTIEGTASGVAPPNNVAGTASGASPPPTTTVSLAGKTKEIIPYDGDNPTIQQMFQGEQMSLGNKTDENWTRGGTRSP